MTISLGRIHEDFARIFSESVDPWGRSGLIDSQLGKYLQRVLQGLPHDSGDSLGGGQLTFNLVRIHEDFARITS